MEFLAIRTSETFPGAFTLEIAPGETGSAAATEFIERVHALLASKRVRDIGAADDLLHGYRTAARQNLLDRLARCLRAVNAAEARLRDDVVRKQTLQTYRDEGFYEQWLARIETIPFTVTTIAEPRRGGAPPAQSPGPAAAQPGAPQPGAPQAAAAALPGPRAAAAGAAQEDGLVSDIMIRVRDVHISPERQKLKIECDEAATVVKAVFAAADPEQESCWRYWFGRWHCGGRGDEASRKLHEYMTGLAGIARVGLTHVDPSAIEFATRSLASFKEEFRVREGGIIKNRYVQRLGWTCLLTFVLLLAYYWVALYQPPSSIGYRFRNFFMLGAGAAAGTWLSFLIRRIDLSFRDLVLLEDDRLNPGVRVLFVLGLTTVVGLLFITGALTFAIGEFKADFRNAETHAALLGLLCGIAERSLATAVGRRAQDVPGVIGGKGP